MVVVGTQGWAGVPQKGDWHPGMDVIGTMEWMWCEVWRWTEREKESQGQEKAGRNLPGAPPGNSMV